MTFRDLFFRDPLYEKLSRWARKFLFARHVLESQLSIAFFASPRESQLMSFLTPTKLSNRKGLNELNAFFCAVLEKKSLLERSTFGGLITAATPSRFIVRGVLTVRRFFILFIYALARSLNKSAMILVEEFLPLFL